MLTPASIASLRTTPQAKPPAGLGEVGPSGDRLDQAKARKEAFGQFVGETFIGQMLKSMRQTVGEPAYFHGGSAEKQFQARLDAQIAQDLATSGPDGLAEELFASSFPAEAALLEQHEAASLEGLDALRRR